MNIVYNGPEEQLDQVKATWDENRVDVEDAPESVRYVYRELSHLQPAINASILT
jgi:hypothetical protein